VAFDPALTGLPFFDSARLARSRGSLVAARQRALEERAQRLRNDSLATDVVVVWQEPAHEAIIRAALREKADLVVIGRHEPRANRRPQYRLTDWELMRLCPRPLLITVGSGKRAGAVLAALDPSHAHDKPASLDVSIARYADVLARALGIECHAVHCVPRSAYPPNQSSLPDRRTFDRRMKSRMKQLIAEAGAEMKTASVLRGSAAQRLPLFALRLPAQVLAMGIVSRRWAKRIIIGDTAESIIREVSCDLLLIKPANFRVRLGRTLRQAVTLPATSNRG
jgi:universal stress protein E